MGRIDLKQNEGIRPTDMPTGGISDTTGYALHGMNALERADNRLAAGIKHVSDALFNISKDMKSRDIRLESANAQIEYFDRSQEALRTLSEKDIRNQDEYEAAYNAAMDKVDSGMGKWAEKNMSWGESRESLSLIMKSERTKNFAQAMGAFLKAKNQRAWNDCETLIKRGVDSGNYEIGKTGISIYCADKSEDLAKRLLDKYDYDFCLGRMKQSKVEILGATSPEQIDEIIAQLQSNGYDSGVYEKDRLEFDVFASIHKDRLVQAENSAKKTVAKSNQTAATEKTEAVKADVSDAIRTTEEMGLKVGKMVDFDGTKKALKQTYDSLGISPERQKKLMSDFDNFCRNERESISKQVNANMYAQAEKALIDAVENNDGRFDINILSGGNEGNAKQLEQARKKYSDWTEKNEGLSQKFKSGKLTSAEAQKYEAYRAEYFDSLRSILEYDKQTDPRGEKLAKIIVDIDKYDSAARKELTDALYGKVVKNAKSEMGKAPSNWTSGELKDFDKEFSSLCEWNSSWYKVWETSDPVGFAKLRNRILQFASLRKLTYAETMDELKKDPFFKRVMLMKSRENAIKLLNL